MATPDATRLKELIERERLNLGIEYKELAARAGLAPETLRALRSSGKASSLSKRRVEDVLGWEPGSIDAVLAGRDPKPVDRARRKSDAVRDHTFHGPDELEQLRAENVELRAQVEEVEGLRSELLELRTEIERLRNVRNPVVESG